MTTIKKGFKKTDIGEIPVDWEIKLMKDICWVNQGLQISISERAKIPTKNSKVYITIQYLNDGKDAEYIKDYSQSVCCTVDDILMTRTGNTGIVVSGVEGVFHNNFFKINFDSEKVFRQYLLYFLNDTKTQKVILDKAGTSTIPDLNHNDFYSIKIPLPPLPEQKAIAKVLSDMDNLITALEAEIEKMRLVKQGAMQELLSAGEDWEVRSLGEIGECIIGLTYKPENISSDGILVLRSSNIQNNTLAYDNNVFVDLEVNEKLINKENDILICVRNGSKKLIGKCALIKGDAIGETFGAFMSMFRSPYNEYLINIFQSDIMKKQIEEHLGATINQITNKSLNSFKVPFPPLSEQTRIAKILTDIDLTIGSKEAELRKYRAMKVGLMQELLSGKRRLIRN